MTKANIRPDAESMPSKPTDFFHYVIEKRWSFFVRLEMSELTNNQASIVSLVKACREKNLKAIKASMNRIDGRLAQIIEVEYPRFYMDFPQAPTTGLNKKDKTKTYTAKETDDSIPSEGLRNTLRILGKSKTGAVRALLEMADEVEKMYLNEETDIYPPEQMDPYVKGVIIACLLDMGHGGDLSAIFEVLDTIDGVVADKVKLIGDDMVIQSPALVAPSGAFLSDEGVARIELPSQSKSWGDAIATKKGLPVAGREGE